MKIFVTLTTYLISLMASAGIDYHGYHINARINVSPEMESQVIDVLDQITSGLLGDELYQKMADKKFTCTKMSNEEIIQKIQDSHFEIIIQADTLGDRVTASTTDNIITINQNFKQDNFSWTNTLFHEMLHTIGFGHCGHNNPRIYRKILRSVPYLGGDMMEEVIKNYGGNL